MAWRRKKQHVKRKKDSKQQNTQKNVNSGTHDYDIDINKSLTHNLKNIKDSIGHSPDVIIRKFELGTSGLNAAIVYIDGLADKEVINEKILFPLMNSGVSLADVESENMTKLIGHHIIPIGNYSEVHTLDSSMLDVLSGSTLLVIDTVATMLSFETYGWEDRAVDEPVSEALVRGPRDGFTETLQTNRALLRRRLRDPNLSMINYKLGRRSKTDVAVCFLKGIVNENLVNEVQRRIQKIDIDDVTESGIIEQLIEDNFLTPFPQVQNTERPGKVSAALMEGRVGILIDGTPFALIVPVTIGMLMQSPEDYYERWMLSSLLRVMRYISAFFALSLPSLYVALIAYHQGLIPTRLAIFIAGTREGVPFPTIIEALIMEFTIEILREAGLRLPKPVGQTVGIVGGLVIGEAAVAAGLVSPMMVVVVALTAISSFALPQYGLGIAIRILRFVMMFAAAMLGLYGIILFYILISIHVVKLKSFGVTYAAPFVPIRPNDWKDLIIRMPTMSMKDRPTLNKTMDKRRIGSRHTKKTKGGN